MSYLTVDKKEDLIETILSIENSLSFATRRKLIMKMRSIDFIENQRHDNNGFCWISFQGIVGEQVILLRFSNNAYDNTDKLFYLIEKSFFKKMGQFNLPHRDNDLPSTISYGLAGTIEKNKSFMYHLNGEHKRINIKSPITVKQYHDGIHSFYYIPETITENDIYLYSMVFENDKINSALFKTAQFTIYLHQLKLIIPNIDKFSWEEMIDINSHLTSAEKSLIHMANI
jgi:hypothetical protein